MEIRVISNNLFGIILVSDRIFHFKIVYQIWQQISDIKIFDQDFLVSLINGQSIHNSIAENRHY